MLAVIMMIQVCHIMHWCRLSHVPPCIVVQDFACCVIQYPSSAMAVTHHAHALEVPAQFAPLSFMCKTSNQRNPMLVCAGLGA